MEKLWIFIFYYNFSNFWKNCQFFDITQLKHRPDFDTYFYIIGQAFTNFQQMCCQLMFIYFGMIFFMMLYLKTKKGKKETKMQKNV
jgi:hypothetical protein